MDNRPEFFDMSAAPMRIRTVRLKVRDLKAVTTFYQTVLGLSPIETGDHRITLGTESTPLLDLRGDATLAPDDPRQAGLFHTAFLLPSRADLARWLAHAVAMDVPLQGASDHIVSEAIYLADPEGNGIEIYADYPVPRWHGENGEIRMSTKRLDVQNLLEAADGTAWSGFPADGTVGHVHLRVGDTDAADRFYRDVVGFDIATRYPGASFYGSGGYHHQVAGNVWNSRGAQLRPKGMAGLDGVEIAVRDAADLVAIAARAENAGTKMIDGPQGITLLDPWCNAVTLKN